jgi:hypothetical protein
MNYLQVLKGSILGLGLMTCTFAANAQKIDEQELKVNVGKITNSTQHLKNLEPVTFQYDLSKYKHLKLPAGQQYGFLASNVQPEFPGMVYEASKIYNAGKNNAKTARYNEVQTENLIPVLVAAIKEQQAEIELLKKELNQLKARSK